MSSESGHRERFSVRRVVLSIAVVGVCNVVRVGFRPAWQAFQEHQARTKAQQNLKSIGEALANYEEKQKQKQASEPVAEDQTEQSK
jgi:hypothetical protein